jgi:hypothetical protein
MSKIWVVAGDARQADVWIRSDLDRRWDAGEKTISKSEYVYVCGPKSLRGIKNPRGVFVGTWRQRPDIRSIVETLMICSNNNNIDLNRIYHEL